MAALGYRHADPIKHNVTFCDVDTEFHSNNVESENGRLKTWARIHGGQCLIEELDMFEYVYYVKVWDWKV